MFEWRDWQRDVKRPTPLTAEEVERTVEEILAKHGPEAEVRIWTSSSDQDHVVRSAGFSPIPGADLDAGEWRVEVRTPSPGKIVTSVAADETNKESSMKTQNVDTGEALTAEMLEDDRASILRGDMVVVCGSDRVRLIAIRILNRGDVTKLDPGMLEPDEWAVITMQRWRTRSAEIDQNLRDGVDPENERIDREQEKVEAEEHAARIEKIKAEGVAEYIAERAAATDEDAAALGAEDDPTTASAPEDGGWVFDEAVAAAFDDMLAKSIPNYREMRDFCTNAAEWIIDRQGTPVGARPTPVVVDLGASRGTGLAPIIERVGDRARYRAYEIADPMLKELEGRFGRDPRVHVHRHDLRDGAPGLKCDVVLSVLTLQFVPIEHRQKILRQVYESLNPGGALILVEKVLGEAHETNVMLTDLYYGMKAGNGYTQEAIHRKRVSLEGVLVPATAKWNEDLLRGAGFDIVETFWRYLQFSGWMAVKR